eukprot:COSAG06_NODE_1250_length_10106_cov_413.553113_5_plen_126_part_00
MLESNDGEWLFLGFFYTIFDCQLSRGRARALGCQRCFEPLRQVAPLVLGVGQEARSRTRGDKQDCENYDGRCSGNIGGVASYLPTSGAPPPGRAWAAVYSFSGRNPHEPRLPSQSSNSSALFPSF